MTYLVDANVLSEPTKLVTVQQVVDWLDANEAGLVVSPVVMGEIWRGVDALPDGRKKRDLAAWFEKLRKRMPSLDWTVEIALVWAEMVNQVKRSASEWSPDLVTWLASGETRNGIPARTFTVAGAGGILREAMLNTSGLTRASLRLKLTCP